MRNHFFPNRDGDIGYCPEIYGPLNSTPIMDCYCIGGVPKRRQECLTQGRIELDLGGYGLGYRGMCRFRTLG